LGKEESRARYRARAKQRYAQDPVYREKILQIARAYRARHKAEISARNKLRRASDPKHRERQRRSYLKQAYGISSEEYAALLTAQGKVCAICKKKDRKRLSVDHCHDTRTVRGLLCTKCNIGLGHFDDDIERLRAAIAYLERARGKR
jgi:Recombination endonuclease VII